MTELEGTVSHKLLTSEMIEQYRRSGYYFPIRVMAREEALTYLNRMEAYERKIGRPLQGNMRHKVHLLFTWANELVRHPKILDAVEDLIGPNILCWTTNMFTKEAHSPGFVSWHQDSTYWGLQPADVVTVWLALSDSTPESGAMRFSPGSHHKDQIPHQDTYDQNNLLTRGQVAVTDIDESQTVVVVLEAGEMSLHHVRLLHASGPNNADYRRVGLAARYIPTYVKQAKIKGDSAMLVRGVDEYGHFEGEAEPEVDGDEAALAAHSAAMARQVATYYQGTDKKEMRS